MDNSKWDNFIEELKTRNNILDVVSSYIYVSQKGGTYMAACPFHGEKVPSLSIRPQGGYYKCFGCGKGGDVISFVMEYESCDFMQAVEILAKRVGLSIPEKNIDDAALIEKNKRKKLCIEICTQTAKFYHQCLFLPQGKLARDYLVQRGFSRQTVTAFGIGYSPDSVSLPQYLVQKGFNLDDCCTAGVLQKSATKSTYYDALNGRLIIPILNSQGEVIAFGGRILIKSDETAKYKNTSETPIFEKSKNLFAINLVRKNKSANTFGSLIMLEGYMDVISLYQAGFTNSVASMGTSLTKEQAKLASRFTDKIYICYDGDNAGKVATLRGLDILKEQKLSVYVISLPNSLDPDDYIKKFGAKKFQILIEQALPLVDYKLKLLQNSYDTESQDEVKRKQERINYIKDAIDILLKCTSIERQAYIETVAIRAGVDNSFIEKQIDLRSQENGTLSENDFLQAYEEEMATNRQQKLDKLELSLCFIARCFLEHKDFVSSSFSVPEEFDYFGRVFRYCLNCYAQNKQPDLSNAYTFSQNEREKQYADAILFDYLFDNKIEEKKYYSDCIFIFEEWQLMQERKKLLRALELAEDTQQKDTITTQILQTADKLKQLRKKRED